MTASADNREGRIVSAVVATRDRPELLRRALRSILDQSYPGPIEVTVVYDQSEPDDGLHADLRSHLGPDRRLQLVPNTNRPGLAGARNSGVAHSTGDFIAFCDDDDEWLPEKVSTQVKALDENAGAWFCAGGYVVNFRGHVHVRRAQEGYVQLASLLRQRNAALHPSTFLVRAADLRRLGPVDEQLPGGYGEDYDLLLRAARVAPVLALPGPLATVYWHSASFFSDRWLTIISANDYLKHKHPEFADQPADAAWLDGKSAFALAAVGQRRQARSAALSALRRRPGQKQALAALVLSTGLVKASSVQRLAQLTGKGI